MRPIRSMDGVVAGGAAVVAEAAIICAGEDNSRTIHMRDTWYSQQPEYERVEGDNNNISHDVAHYSSTLLPILHADAFVTQAGQLMAEWILLDSSLTTDIISDSNLLHNIHDTTELITIGSLGGQIKLNQKGYLGNYPYPVWYNPNGIANILSLFNISKAYRVTGDHGYLKESNNASASEQ
jgi:hypothetical protein